MKIKRFDAPDMRTALRRVQAELGADAVILSTENRGDQVCVIAALDYDAALVAPAKQGLADLAKSPALPHPPQPSRSSSASASLLDELCAPESAAPTPPADAHLQRLERELEQLHALLAERLPQRSLTDPGGRQASMLQAMGVAEAIHQRVVAACGVEASSADQSALLAEFSRRVPVTLKRGTKLRAIALVGPTGAGKTTTAAKLAARHLMRNTNNRVRLVCTDSFRIGGREQLQIFARLLGTGVEVLDSADELRELVASAGPQDLIVIDTPGIGPRDKDIAAQLPMLGGLADLHVALCLPAPLHPVEMRRVLSRYAAAKPMGLVLTKVDESQQLGVALSVAIETSLPILWITDGQRVPEDLHRLDATALVARGLAQRDRGLTPERGPDRLLRQSEVAHVYA